MKKVLTLVISSLMIMAFLSSCSKDQVKSQATDTAVNQAKDVVVKSDSGDNDFAVSAINRQVKGFAIDGFPGGSSKLSKSEDLENMKRIVGLVKPIIDQIPAGYVMQITGHAADYPTKSLQRSVSKARAAKIYNELKKAGVPTKKMSYKGVGITELADGYDSKDPKQRRVSFKAVKK